MRVDVRRAGPSRGPVNTSVLPPGIEAPPVAFHWLGDLSLEAPEATPRLARDVAVRLRHAAPRLAALRTDAILRAIDDTVAEWIAPRSEARLAAEEAFCASTDLPRETAPFGPLLEAFAAPRFREWVRQEVVPLEALDGFVPGPDGAPVRATGPGLAVHILPGNVPLVWLPSFLACVVMRAPCVLKPAQDDPLTPALFVATLIRKLPALAAGLAVMPWAGGDAAVESEVLREAAAVIVYGGGETVAALARRLSPEAHLTAHGPRVALAAVGREMTGPGRIEPAAMAAARDALVYDGRGCLSLPAVYLEAGGLYAPREAAESFARAMEKVSHVYPPGRPDRDTAALTQGWRARIRARMIAGKPSRLWASPQGLDWTVIYDEELAAPDASLVRTLWLSPVPSVDDLPARLQDRTGRLHAFAWAGPESRRAALAEALVPLGLTRVAALGSLQTPPLTWPHGGTSPFRQLLRWTRIER